MNLTEVLGIKYPIIQGAMAQIATADLAAAVSNAGGLGIIASGGFSPDRIREEIRRCKELTDKPFGVNVMLMHPNKEEIARIVVEEKVKVVTRSRLTSTIYEYVEGSWNNCYTSNTKCKDCKENGSNRC